MRLQTIFMINLIPLKQKKQIKKLQMVRMINTVLLGVILILVVGALLVLPTLFTVESRFDLTKERITVLEKEGALPSDVNIESLTSRAKKVQSKLTVKEKKTPLEYIATIESARPPLVVVQRFSISKPLLVEVFGTAPDRETLQLFVTTLKNNSSIALVDNPVSNFVITKDKSFKITVSFK